jgi:glutamate N-acetyltransferase/amino-acid N-acetyltransferase
MMPTTRFAPLPPFAKPAPGGVCAPAGFVAAGVAAGVKRSGRLDLGVLCSEVPCVSAAVFTGNAAAAAPVRLTSETSACGRLRAVVVNAGNANACTGKQGLGDAARMRLLAADGLRVAVEEVAVASTGVIGVPLPMPAIERGIAAAAAAVSRGGGPAFAAAIRTTDRKDKQGSLALDLEAGRVHVGFACKGAGMISPNMATMLCFVTTDALIAPTDLDAVLRAAIADSFNRITVDGQESTNDTVIAMANGASGVRVKGDDLASFASALRSVLVALAVTIVADGEGSTKAVRLCVTGAGDEHEAESVARAVANSPLVKTAFFGCDPNWGRIVQAVGQAIGRTQAAAPQAAGRTHSAAGPAAGRTQSAGRTRAAATRRGPIAADVAYDEIAVIAGGREVALDERQQRRLAAIMEQTEIDLHVGLGAGSATAMVYFSDLTHQYVTLNAEYTT